MVRFCNGNDHFFLNLVMPACKLALDAGRDVPGSTLVVAMARNGTDFGVQVSGTGDRWFTAPALVPEGLFLGSYGPDDANPDIGDSAITETAGIGGFAMAAAPAIVAFVGGDSGTAVRTTRRMYEITLGEHPAFQIASMALPRHPGRHRRHRRGAHRDPAADQHRHGRQGGRARARSAPGSSRRRRSASPRRWPRWRSRPGPLRPS